MAAPFLEKTRLPRPAQIWLPSSPLGQIAPRFIPLTNGYPPYRMRQIELKRSNRF